MKNSLVVIMSVFNGERFLGEAIESILNQTYEDFELLIIDDGSSDRSKIIIEKYANKDSRIKVIYKENSGLTKSLNVGIDFSRKFNFVARMDADDVSEPTRLEKQIHFLLDHPDYALVGTGVKIIDDVGKVTKYSKVKTGYMDIKHRLKVANCFAHGSVMLNQNLLKEQLYYNENFPYAQDYDLWTRIVSNYKVDNIDEHLYRLRKHRESISSSKTRDQTLFASLIGYNFSKGSENCRLDSKVASDETFKFIAFLNFLSKGRLEALKYFQIKNLFNYILVIYKCFLR